MSNMERCMSCISKLGAPTMSRSSTATGAGTPGTGQPPNWSLLNGEHNYPTHQQMGSCASTIGGQYNYGSAKMSSAGLDRMSVCSSHGSYGSSSSEYSVPRLSSCAMQMVPAASASHEPWSGQSSGQSQCTTHRPPKSKSVSGDTVKSVMVLPLRNASITNQPGQQKLGSQYDNYDIPKTPIQIHTMKAKSVAMENYDTPKKIQEYLINDMNSNPTDDMYGNYDMPTSLPGENGGMIGFAAAASNVCGCLVGIGRTSDANCSKPTAHNTSSVARLNCTCNKVMSWADSWIPLPYCRRGSGIENTSMSINKVKLNGEGKMPVVQPSGELAIYATVDTTKKIKKKFSEVTNNCDCQHTGANDGGNVVVAAPAEAENYIDLEPSREDAGLRQSVTQAAADDSAVNRIYMNLKLARSMENLEHTKETMQRANALVGETMDVPKGKLCQKCGHSNDRKTADASGSQAVETTSQDVKSLSTNEAGTAISNEREWDDYLLMGPGKNSKSSTGYPPMLTANTQASDAPSTAEEANEATTPTADIETTRFEEVLPPNANELSVKPEPLERVDVEISANNSSLEPSIDDNSQLDEPNSQLLDVDCLPNDKQLSASVSSSPFLDDKRYVDGCVSTETLRRSMDAINIVDAAMVSCTSRGRRASSPCVHQEPCPDWSLCGSSLNQPFADRTEQSSTEDDASVSLNHSNQSHQSAYIRRSASVPCKGQNRDSSSSNDSGVSTGSIRNRTTEYADFELTTTLSSRRHKHRQHYPTHTVHASLPRRSKSYDPLSEIAFQFKRGDKSMEECTSAGAEVPVFPPKVTLKTKRTGSALIKEAKALNGSGQPFIDSRSTSSGTSDMSDFIETLSSYSHSSSDTAESLR